MTPKTVMPTQITGDPQVHENLHVHAVYDQIASHFSSTRYKPWPIIAQFLSTLPTGSVGLDSGTGNGKYLPLPLDRPPGSIWTIGLDRSRNLLEIAKTAGQDDDAVKKSRREVVWGDILGKGWRNAVFDYAISIATIHHLATHERRKLAIQRLIQCVSATHGRVLIYVWAIEQDELSKRDIPNQTNIGDLSKTGKNSGQDVFIPWVMPQQNTNQNKGKTRAKLNRALIYGADSADISHDRTGETLGTRVQDEPQIFNRYYHMFAKGELVHLVREAANELGLYVGQQISGVMPSRTEKGLEIVQDGWEKSNYYVELRCWTS